MTPGGKYKGWGQSCYPREHGQWVFANEIWIGGPGWGWDLLVVPPRGSCGKEGPER